MDPAATAAALREQGALPGDDVLIWPRHTSRDNPGHHYKGRVPHNMGEAERTISKFAQLLNSGLHIPIS